MARSRLRIDARKWLASKLAPKKYGDKLAAELSGPVGDGAKQDLRIPCARETMKSIKESVHQLLEDQITRLGLQAYHEAQKAEIIGRNGTSFTFRGLRDQSVHNIKSLEGADILWVEEAQNVSKKSWGTVIPTIRKPGSEIWVTFNPSWRLTTRTSDSW